MATNNTRGRILRSKMDLGKQNLIGRELYEGHIKQDHLTQASFRVTNKKSETWIIKTDKSLETLLFMDKYKGCVITPLI